MASLRLTPRPIGARKIFTPSNINPGIFLLADLGFGMEYLRIVCFCARENL